MEAVYRLNGHEASLYNADIAHDECEPHRFVVAGVPR
jgi:hypothetical protein